MRAVLFVESQDESIVPRRNIGRRGHLHREELVATDQRATAAGLNGLARINARTGTRSGLPSRQRLLVHDDRAGSISGPRLLRWSGRRFHHAAANDCQ
jgi:dihydroorotate dehydrogenase